MYIYILTNSVNGKKYIGQSINDPLWVHGRVPKHFSGKTKGCSAIHAAIKKYGKDVFDVEVIHYPGASIEALNAIEEWQIVKHGTLSPNGYNLKSGGGNGRYSLESRQKMSDSHKGKVAWNKGVSPSVKSRQKMSESHKGKKLPDEVCRKMSESRKGKKLSPDHCRRISEGKMGKKASPETRKILSESHKGLKQSIETRRKRSASLKGKLKGEKHPFFGKSLSVEHRQKISESLKGCVPWNKGKKGKLHSEETKRKISEKAMGRGKGEKLSDEYRLKKRNTTLKNRGQLLLFE